MSDTITRGALEARLQKAENGRRAAWAMYYEAKGGAERALTSGIEQYERADLLHHLGTIILEVVEVARLLYLLGCNEEAGRLLERCTNNFGPQFNLDTAWAEDEAIRLAQEAETA